MVPDDHIFAFRKGAFSWVIINLLKIMPLVEHEQALTILISIIAGSNDMHFFRQMRIRRNTALELSAAISQHKEVILIYQPGKVASSTISRTLKQCPQLSVWQLHTLIPENIRRLVNLQLRAGMKPTKCLIQGETIRDVLLVQKSAPYKVITLVREPIEQNISAFFERLPEFFPGKKPDDIPAADLDRVFLNRFPHYEIIDWVDDDFFAALHADLYTQPFHKENKFSSHAYEECPVLTLRTDLPDQQKIAAVTLFLNLDQTPEMVTANRADKKNYSHIYKQFLNRIQLPTQLAEDILTSRYSRHFFTPEERQLALLRWTQSSSSEVHQPIEYRKAG